jgi:hypothetical protein
VTGKPQLRVACEAAEQQPVDDGLVAFAEAADVSAELFLRWLRNLASHAACFQFAGPTLHYVSGDSRFCPIRMLGPYRISHILMPGSSASDAFDPLLVLVVRPCLPVRVKIDSPAPMMFNFPFHQQSSEMKGIMQNLVLVFLRDGAAHVCYLLDDLSRVPDFASRLVAVADCKPAKAACDAGLSWDKDIRLSREPGIDKYPSRKRLSFLD